MAYGGGTFKFQNKELGGAYINFVSAKAPLNSVSDRGVGALPIALDWGVDGEVFEVTNEQFQKDTLRIFGYGYTHEKMKGLRDFFKHAKIGYFYRTNANGTKASNKYATALYNGVRGNDISIAIEQSVDEVGKYIVTTLLDGMEVDKQVVKDAKELKENGYVTFKAGTLTATAGEKLLGGTTGSTTGEVHQKALDALEAVPFNTLGCLSDDEVVKGLYVAYTKRMREDVGKNFQLVVYNPIIDPDHEGIIKLGDVAYDPTVKDADTQTKKAMAISGVYWVTGASAGCDIDKSNENRKYDGEFAFEVKTTQNDLKKQVRAGYFSFHKINDTFVVLQDINSLTSFTTEKNKPFRLNQVIRILDQVGNDVAHVFNQYYLGKTQNDEMGRNALFAEINDYILQLVQVRAIQNYDYKKDLVVTEGREKEGVYVMLKIEPTVAMSKLYMVVEVR